MSYDSAFSTPGAVVVMMAVVAVFLLVLYFVVRNAVTEGMKSHQKWREKTGRVVLLGDLRET